MSENAIVEELQEVQEPNGDNAEKSFVTVKNVLRMLGLCCLIFAFCPAFLVSCAGQTIEVDVATAIKGVEMYGEQVVDPYPVMALCLLIPVAALVLLFTKFLDDKKSAIALTAGLGGDILLWLAFQSAVEKIATENNCKFETTGWFTLNMISMIAFLIIAVLLLIKKIEFDTDLLTKFPGVAAALKDPNGPVQKAIEKVKALPAKTKMIAIGVVAGVVLIVTLIATASSTINLNKYVTVKTEGYNGYGKAQVSVDWEAVSKDFGDKLEFSDAAKETYGEALLNMTPVTFLRSCVKVELDKTYDLSNGDTVNYKWTINEEALKHIKCKVKFADGSQKISGLQGIEKFDPFVGIEVTFSGTAPNGRVSFVNNSDTGLSYKFDKTSGLKNGDVVTLTVSYGYNFSAEQYAAEYGKLPTSTTKEYTVAGLDEYIDEFADLTDAFLSKLKSEAEDSIYAYSANSYGTTYKLSKLTYAGYVLNSVKEGSSSTYNEIYVIYTGIVTKNKNGAEGVKVYYPVRFTNILNTKGELSFAKNNGIYGSCYFPNSWNSTKGYVNPVLCYNGIAKDPENYNVEVGGGFEKYGKYELVTKLNDITSGFRTQISDSVKKLIEAYIAEDYAETTVVSGLKEEGIYFMLAKNQGSNIVNNNRFYVVYSATISSTEDNFETTTVYYPVLFEGLVKLGDGEFMYMESDGIAGNSNLGSFWYSTKGYVDPELMFTNLITANREKFTYEMTDGLKQFGN